MFFLVPRYDPALVTASVSIATLSAYVMLDFAKRGQRAHRRLSGVLLGLASLAMGTGIWSMHFVGMLAYALPIPLGYGPALTGLSWAASVVACFVALRIAVGERSLGRVLVGSLAMGAGICTMHFVGMAALDMAPAIVWDARLVAVSVLIAVSASAAALWIFFWLRDRGLHDTGRQAAAALVMGLATSGMHYTGMAAARFSADSVCLSADALGGHGLGALALLVSTAMLVMTLVVSSLDLRMRRRTERFAGSLKAANDRLRIANRALRVLARTDALTGLPNRAQFEDRLRQVAGVADPAGAPRLAVLFVDLDRFRTVNDVFGHGAGDHLLKACAGRLQAGLADGDVVARIGGDNFVVLRPFDAATRDVGAIQALAGRLIEAIEQPFDLGNRQVSISASIGVAVYPDHGPAKDLLVFADAAMFAAKRKGGGACTVFAPDMEGRSLQAMELHNDLRLAIERGELSLHYQPKVDARRGTIRGVEALLRWHHPQRGAISPASFVPVAEQFGLIVPLGQWVVEEACRQMRAWADTGLRMRVAVNISAHQLRRSDFAQGIQQALDRHLVDPSQLLCEITESVAMEDIKGTQRAFEQLGTLGVFLSIDDFGTGYSSLSYLRQLPARQLKIDRSFVKDLESSADARAIVDAVIHLAHALGLSVVAEGVETAAQRDALIGLGCDELQGYFFARPMSDRDLLAWAWGQKPIGGADFSPSLLLEREHALAA